MTTIDLGLYDSDTGESLVSTKVVDVSGLQNRHDRALLVFSQAKQGRIVQLRFPYGPDDDCGLQIHYFFDDPVGLRMIAEDEARFGFSKGALLTAIMTNAPAPDSDDRTNASTDETGA